MSMTMNNTPSGRLSAKLWIAPVISLALLSALTARELTYPRATDATPYHHSVRDAAAEVPHRQGGWIGSDIEPMEGLRRPRVDLPGDEVPADGVPPHVSGVRAPPLDQPHRHLSSIVLGLHPRQREAHGREILGEDVGDTVLRAHDLDA